MFNKYLSRMSGLFILLVLLTMAFNLAVNPYRLFPGLPFEVSWIPDHKPELSKVVRMFKAHEVGRVRPEVIFIGSSRADTGLDPAHALWTTRGQIYNLSLSSARIAELLAYIKHAQATTPLSDVVLGLDFLMFDSEIIYEAGFSEQRLAHAPLFQRYPAIARDYVSGLLSFDALQASYSTLLNQATVVTDYGPDGARIAHLNQQRLDTIGGHYQAFALQLLDLKNEAARDVTVRLLSTSQQAPSNALATSLETFRELLTFCQQQKIALHMFISPIHALRLERLRIEGRWQEFENWKRELASTVTSYQQRGGKMQLWDFAYYHKYSTEPLPIEGDSDTHMRWYWEGSHYKQSLGNLILDQLAQPDIDAHGFGVELTTDNTDAHLRRVNNTREQMLAEDQQTFASWHKLIHQYL